MTKEKEYHRMRIPIAGAKKYSVDKRGIIINDTTKKVIKSHLDTSGYPIVKISADTGSLTTMKIHRIVATAFVENPENKPHVNHKDSNRENCSAGNLEWVTPKENHQHALTANGGYAGGTKPRRCETIHAVTGEVTVHNTLAEAAAMLNSPKANIHRAIVQPQRSVKGHKVRYV